GKAYFARVSPAGIGKNSIELRTPGRESTRSHRPVRSSKWVGQPQLAVRRLRPRGTGFIDDKSSVDFIGFEPQRALAIHGRQRELHIWFGRQGGVELLERLDHLERPALPVAPLRIEMFVYAAAFPHNRLCGRRLNLRFLSRWISGHIVVNVEHRSFATLLLL